MQLVVIVTCTGLLPRTLFLIRTRKYGTRHIFLVACDLTSNFGCQHRKSGRAREKEIYACYSRLKYFVTSAHIYIVPTYLLFQCLP